MMELFIIVLLFITLSCTCAYNVTYEWQSTQWSSCTTHDPHDCCQCSRQRITHCVLKSNGKLIPPFYCRKLSEPKPHESESCAHCDRDCVHSTWGDWSTCSETCLPATRYRTRQVLVLPSGDGRECSSLIDVESCKNLARCDFVDPRPDYRWKMTPWTSCRKRGSDVGVVCGEGLQLREVFCVDKHDEKLADDFCLQYMQGQPKPADVEPCEMPCPCAVSDWSSWTSCSQTCHMPMDSYHRYEDPGYQARTREVISNGDSGGIQCPQLIERRICKDAPQCNRYIWQWKSWSECSMPPQSREKCGSGEQHRDVLCVLEGDSTETGVDGRLCMQEPAVSPKMKLRPPDSRACEVMCPQNCQLGEWEGWSVCSQSCGHGGRRIRRKPILVEATPGGRECGERYERADCDPTPCIWWNIGQWSTCFPHDYEAVCGPGSQIRNVYCVSSMDQVLQDYNCSSVGRRPPGERDCRVPCADECALSEWSLWGRCSLPCGSRGAIQSRSRTVTRGLTSCVSGNQLNETRLCNKRSCDLHVWQVTPWRSCESSENTTVSCGELGSGEQRRDIWCETRTGERVNSKKCISARPQSNRQCIVLCPQNCVLGPWSLWTDCGDSCGEGNQYRSRKVERLALYHGSGCEHADQNGLIYEKHACQMTSVCERLAWNATSWSGCQTLSKCGQGIKRRQVYCTNSDGRLLDTGKCSNKVLGAPPSNQKTCYKPCESDCALSEWSQFSQCSVTCGENVGVQTRYRSLIHTDETMTLEKQCPHLTEAHLVSSQPCEDKLCPVYSWEVGEWTVCIPDSDTATDCGPGIQKRHVFCRGSDGQHTSLDKCSGLELMPERFRECELFCQSDCQVAQWGSWGPCSHSCGYGLATRTREIEKRPLNGGRKCPSLIESEICTDYDCEDFIWAVEPWGECRPHFRKSCGVGQRSRQVTCPAGKPMEAECRRRAQKPVVLEQCRIPCEGDCEMFEWSPWSICDCSQQNATKSRIRQILTEPSHTGEPCGASTEVDACPCPGYRLLIGNWTNCQADRGLCGRGSKQRWIQCMRQKDNVAVPLSYCAVGSIQLTEDCEVTCPRDCQLTEFSEWSGCKKTCGVDAIKQRTRDVIRKNNKFGRHCPSKEALAETTTCDSTACYTYQWHESPWSQCTVDVSKTCGLGMTIKTKFCQRSDGFVVNNRFCGQEKQQLKEEVPCGLPCPGDCVMSQWSHYGDCFNYCKDNKKGFQVRSRTTLIPAKGGKACPNNWVEKKHCSNPLCPHFYWKMRSWEQSGRRKVYCSPDGADYKVYGGCKEQEKPARKLDCNPHCGIYGNCLEGDCVCQAGFKGDGYICLPEYGCHANLHCIVNNSFCDPSSKECLCLDGTLPSPDMYCAAPLSQGNKSSGLSVVVIYILIGCLCGVILLAIIIAVCYIRRRKPSEKQSQESTPPRLAKIDNLDMERNNTLHKLQDDSTYRSQKSDFSDNSDMNVAKTGREGIAPSTSMPLYYGKSHNLNDPNISRYNEDDSVDSGYHGKSLGNLELPPHHLLTTYQAAPYMANVQPQPRSASAIPYVTCPPRTPTPETSMTTFKPDDSQITESPWSVIHKPDVSPRVDKQRRFLTPLGSFTGGGGGGYLSPADGPSVSLTPTSTPVLQHSPSGHALYRVPEHSVPPNPVRAKHQRGQSDPDKSVLKSANPIRHSPYHADKPPKVKHQRGNSDPDSPTGAFPGESITSKSPHKTAAVNGGTDPPGYNSLPRHYGHLRLPKTYGLDQPETAHSDVEQLSTESDGPYNNKYNQKYGSLPSKGRRKKDAAQNLLDYCDALLADLEKAAAP